jgi:hypothetical protein
MATQRENDWDSGWWSGIAAGAVGALIGRAAYNLICEEKDKIAPTLLVAFILIEPVVRVTRSFRPNGKDKSA